MLRGGWSMMFEGFMIVRFEVNGLEGKGKIRPPGYV